MLAARRSAVSAAAGPRRAAPSVSCRATKAAGNWMPGQPAPAHLAGADLAGNYGFDPLNLSREPSSMARFREAEVVHGRWAMLGVAGCLAVELLGFGNWYDAPLWAVDGSSAGPTWFGVAVPFDLNTLLGVEFVAMAAAESSRGSAEPEKRVYPGGAFDPLGMAKGDASELKLKEIKNGRLVSFPLGSCCFVLLGPPCFVGASGGVGGLSLTAVDPPRRLRPPSPPSARFSISRRDGLALTLSVYFPLARNDTKTRIKKK